MIPPLAIIQARIRSSRLPRKMLLPIAGKPLIWHAWNACCDAFGPENTVIACPVGDVDAFRSALPGAWVWGFGGEEEDVLGRLYAVASEFRTDPKTVIHRITPDDLPPVLYRDHWTLAQLETLHTSVTGRVEREHIGWLMPTQGRLEVNTQRDYEKAQEWYG